jgi:hypothetical protein
MIRAANLPQRLANILAARGKTADFLKDVRCVDDSDGQMPRLAYWNAALLGPEPTQAEVDAASDQPNPKDAIKKQLSDIDKSTGSVRWVRELALGFKELHGILVSNGTQLPALGSGMAKVQAIEDQCKALRQQLSQL